MDEHTVEGLRPLPIEDIVSLLLVSFPDAVREPNGESDWIVWIAADQMSSFQITWSPVHVAVTLRPLSHDLANQMIDVLTRFDCPLYDPQTNKRY
jgi:hypothetical protein